MLSVLLGMAFSNDVVFLSHQLQFALLLAVLCSYVTHELGKKLGLRAFSSAGTHRKSC